MLVYLSEFVINRRVLFWDICNLYLVGRVRKLRGTVGYMRARRMVTLYSLLCWLGPKNFFNLEGCFSTTFLFLVA